jgi:hypothetical protein
MQVERATSGLFRTKLKSGMSLDLLKTDSIMAIDKQIYKRLHLVAGLMALFETDALKFY